MEPVSRWDTRRRPSRSAMHTALRLIVVLVSLLLSSYGLLFGYAGLAGFFGQGDGSGSLWSAGIGLMMGYAWIAWLVMAFAWVFEFRLHTFWPVSGTLAGVGSVIVTLGFAIIFTFPALIMAIVFVAFHLSAEPPAITTTADAAD